METTTIGALRILVPDLDPDVLEPLPGDEPPDDDLDEVVVDGASWPDLELVGVRFTESRFVGVDLTGLSLRNGNLTSCVLEGVDLSNAVLAGTTIDRCVFTGCRFTGAHLIDTVLRNAIFVDCRFDYATLDGVRTAGPTAWVNSSLANGTLARCRLTSAALSSCRLTELELRESDLRGADLRGSDLSGVLGMTGLRGTTVTADQLTDLMAVVVRELALTVNEDSVP